MFCPTPKKARFETKEEAESEIIFFGKRGQLFVYLCGCGYYHLTKTPPKKQVGRYF